MNLHTPQTDTDTVTTTFVLVAVSGNTEESVTATLVYRAAEPFLVRASFALAGSRSVDWVLSRELLREGVAMPSGLGDVRLYPGDEGLLLELRSNSGRAFLYGKIEPMIEFVRNIYTLVPDGLEHEHFSIDAELANVVGSWIDPDRHRTDSA